MAGSKGLSKVSQKSGKSNVPKIRAFSHEDKMKIIEEAKYTPNNEHELRMEKRYITSQLRTITEAREAE